MSLFVFQFILALCFVVNSNSVPLVTKCKINDKKCMKESAQEFLPKFVGGLPDLGIESNDPVMLDKVDASTQNLKLMLNNLKVTGLKECIMKKLEIHENLKINVAGMCTVDIKGHYDMKGRLIILPIEGNGKVHGDLKKVLVKVEGQLTEITKDGKKYWNIKSWDSSFELKDKSTIQFENLFNGNKDLSQAAEEVIKASGNEIIEEVGAPVLKAFLTKLVESVQKFFHSVPISDLIQE